MHSVRTAASIFYYLGVSPGSETESALLATGFGTAGPIFDGSNISGRSYYDPYAHSDPLKIPAVWHGKLSDSLGYPSGTVVSTGALAAMWHGIDPRDGKTPLKPGGPTIAQQLAIKKRLTVLEAELEKSRTVQNTLKASLREDGLSERAIESDKAVALQQTQVDEAVKAIAALKRDRHYRHDATDQTFSAPKGVSILWARLKTDGLTDPKAAAEATAIEQAMIESVKTVLTEFVEPELLFIRQRVEGSEVSYETVKGVANALFMHFDARPTPAAGKANRGPDPNMHIHSVLMSMALDHDDEVRAMWTDFLGKYSKVIGAAFRGEFAHRLQTLGLHVYAEHQENIHAFDIAGISDSDCAEFSGRRMQIEENMKLGLGQAEAARLGRQSKQDLSGVDLLQKWNDRLNERGISAEKAKRKTVNDLAEEMAHDMMKKGAKKALPDSEAWQKQRDGHRARAIEKLAPKPMTVELAVAKLLEQESAITLIDINRLAMEQSQLCHGQLLPGQTPIAWANVFKKAILRSKELKRVHGQDRLGRPVFTSTKLLSRENDFYAQKVGAMLQKRSDEAIPSQAEVDQAIAGYESSESELRGAPFKLQEFQRSMIKTIALNETNLTICIAPAGTGKSTAALGAVMALEKFAGCRTFAIAPSNSAAGNLAKSFRQSASEGMSPHKLLSDIKHGNVELAANDLLFVDEASMLDFDIAERLFKAAAEAKGGPARIVLMGDTEQLASVGRGDVFAKLAADNRVKRGEPGTANLFRSVDSLAQWGRVARQKSDIGKQATTFFALGHATRALDIYERMGALKTFVSRDETLARMAKNATAAIAEACSGLDDARETLSLDHDAFASTIQAASEVARSKLRQRAKKHLPIDAEAVIKFVPKEQQPRARKWFSDEAQIKAAQARVIDECRSSIMIATKNADVHALNERARDILKAVGAIGGRDGKHCVNIKRGRVGSIEVAEGERIVFREAAKGTKARLNVERDDEGEIDEVKISKSQVGTVLAVWKDGRGDPMLRVQFDGEKTPVDINGATFGHISHAYAITSHLSQGLSFKHVHEMLSSFAASQTDYVGKSRYMVTHSIYAVESEYALYKKNAAQSMKSVEASDRGIARLMHEHFVQTVEHIDIGEKNLDGLLDMQTANLSEQKKKLRQSHASHIAQGILLEHGKGALETSSGTKSSYFAKVQVGGQTRTLWGIGLELAIADSGCKVGDYVGLSKLPEAAPDGTSTAWVCRHRAWLEGNGLYLGDDHLEAKAVELLSADKANEAAAKFQAEFDKSKMTRDESEAVAVSILESIRAIQAVRAEEQAWIEAVDAKVQLPQNISALLDDAKNVIPFRKGAKAAGYAQSIVERGIEVRDSAAPLSMDERQWIASDGQMAYCMTSWGQIEAWSTQKLDPFAVSQAKLAGNIHELLGLRRAAHDAARSTAIKPIEEALGPLARKVSVALIDHPEFGMSLSMSANGFGEHVKDPMVARLFAGNGSYGAHGQPGELGIKNLPSMKRFDHAFDGWIFPINVDGGGMPLDASRQEATQEIIEMVRKLGYASEAAPSPSSNAEAWEAIKKRMLSPWGYAFCEECNLADINVPRPDLVVNRLLSAGAADIVHWNALVDEASGDAAREWELCARAGDRHGDDARILSGVVMHDDGRMIYILSGQRVLSIERELLGLAASAPQVGATMKILFQRNSAPALLSAKNGPVMAVAANYLAADTPESVPELPKQSEYQFAQKLSIGSVASIDNATHDDFAYAHAFAMHEGARLQKRKAELSSGLPEKDLHRVKLLEEITIRNGGEITIKNAAVKATGKAGVVMDTSHGRLLISTEHLRQAMPAKRNAQKVMPGSTIKEMTASVGEDGLMELTHADTPQQARSPR